MRRPGDYLDEMFQRTISDQQIERLLSAAPAEHGELSDLAVFVETLRAYEHAPSDGAVDRLATEAANLVRTGRSSSLDSSRSFDRPLPSRRRLTPQMAAMALAMLIISATTGVAVAADGAAPGDSLYGLDQAMERVGIGAGMADERLVEASQLLAEGQTRMALEHASVALDQGDDDVEEARNAIVTAIREVEVIEDQGDVSGSKVAALFLYMSENIGKGVGADGREFGQGVAELARGITTDEETSEVTDPSDIPSPGKENKPQQDGVPGNGNGTGNGGATTPGNGNATTPGNGNGNATTPTAGNGNGNGNGNANGAGNGNGNADPPGNGNGNGAENQTGGGQGNGKGPPPDSPSVTAPGRGNKP